jgi:hypothetical protein
MQALLFLSSRPSCSSDLRRFGAETANIMVLSATICETGDC